MLLDILSSSWAKLSSLGQQLPVLGDAHTWSAPKKATVAVGGAAGIWLLWRQYYYRNIPPGPPSLPLIGTIVGVHEDTLHKDMVELRKKYGGVYSIWLGNTLVVVLANYAAVKDALGKQAVAFADRTEGMNRALNEYMEFKDDVFASSYDDKHWMKNKNFFINALRGAGFGSTDCAHKVLEKVEKMNEQLDRMADSKIPVDTREVILKTTVNCLFHILANRNWDYDDPKLEEVSVSAAKWNASFGRAMGFEFVPRWIAKLFYGNKIREIRDDSKHLNDIAHEELLYHQKTLDPENPRDFIDLYLIGKGEEHDLKRMIDNIMIYTPDGTESLGSTLYSIMLYLGHHPDVQQKAAEEIESITQGSRYVTWDDHNDMPYTRAIIMEVIRFAMVFPYFPGHAVSKDVTLWGYRIPKNTAIYIAFDAILRDPDVYEDPEVFRPERFLDESGKMMKNEKWIPFSMGKRKCPGEVLVKMEMFVLIANILQRYSFRFPEGESPTVESAGTPVVRLPHRYKVILTRRYPDQ